MDRKLSCAIVHQTVDDAHTPWLSTFPHLTLVCPTASVDASLCHGTMVDVSQAGISQVASSVAVPSVARTAVRAVVAALRISKCKHTHRGLPLVHNGVLACQSAVGCQMWWAHWGVSTVGVLVTGAES